MTTILLANTFLVAIGSVIAPIVFIMGMWEMVEVVKNKNKRKGRGN